MANVMTACDSRLVAAEARLLRRRMLSQVRRPTMAHKRHAIAAAVAIPAMRATGIGGPVVPSAVVVMFAVSDEVFAEGTRPLSK